MSNSDATKPTPRTDVHTFDFDQDSSKCRRPDGSGWYVQADFARQLERELAEAQEAIADLNQRLIDRTTGFMQTLGQQSLEIAALKQERDAARAEVIKLEAQIEEMNRTWGDA